MTIYDADYQAEIANKTGVTDFAADGQDIEPFYTEKASGTDENHIQHSKEMVDTASEKEFNFKALRDSIAQEKSSRESERQRYQLELENMRYEMQRLTSTNESQISRSDPLDGLAGDDLLTVDKFRQAQQEQQQRYENELTALKYENLENRARLRHSDYNDIMEKYSIPLLRNDQDFASGFKNAADPAEYAYKIGYMMMASEKSQAPEPQINRDAQRLVENARKPSTLSNVRGGQNAISTADYYESMSDKDFADLVKKNMERIL